MQVSRIVTLVSLLVLDICCQILRTENQIKIDVATWNNLVYLDKGYADFFDIDKTLFEVHSGSYPRLQTAL